MGISSSGSGLLPKKSAVKMPGGIHLQFKNIVAGMTHLRRARDAFQQHSPHLQEGFGAQTQTWRGPLPLMVWFANRCDTDDHQQRGPSELAGPFWMSSERQRRLAHQIRPRSGRCGGRGFHFRERSSVACFGSSGCQHVRDHRAAHDSASGRNGCRQGELACVPTNRKNRHKGTSKNSCVSRPVRI